MKILMICTEKLPVPAVLGGAIQTYISGILPHLSKHHDITVLGITDPSLPEQETKNGVHFVRVPGKIFELYREGVVRYLESAQFDLIHIFNRPRLVMPVRNAAPGSRITLSMHNDMFNPEKIEPEEAVAALKEVAQIVTVSDYIGKVIRELYPEAPSKIRTIYSGVDHERFLPGNHPKMQKIRNDIRKAHGLENKTVILFAGRLSANKGVDKLVRALPELSKKFKDLALVIVGSKWFSQEDTTDFIAYVRALTNKLPVPVVATGFVSPDEIQNWFAAADLFVCTSIWQEPLARVHYEAMAAGLPIVTTARGGNPEVITLRENGLVVENPEDPGDFEEKITEILSNKSMMKSMGEKGRALAISRFNWNRLATEILEVWEQSKNWSATAAENAEVPIMQNSENELTNQVVSETVSEPENDTVSEPENDTVSEPAKETVIKPAKETVIKPVKQTVIKPVKETVIKPVKEIVIKPVKEIVSETSNDLVPEHKTKTGKNGLSRRSKTNSTSGSTGKSRRETIRDIIRETIRESIKESIRESIQDSFGDTIRETIRESKRKTVIEPNRETVKETFRETIKKSNRKGKLK